MSSQHESADLILRLYDMRREPVMRKARAWLGDFHPASAQAVLDAMHGPDGAYLRQVLSYWGMACALVKHGAIDSGIFNDCNGEHVFVFAKIEPFLAELRKLNGPHFAEHLEQVVRAIPNSAEIIKQMQERQAAMAARARSAAR